MKQETQPWKTPQRQTSMRATAIGFTAILMWATLAFLTKLSGPLPPFQLTAMAFTLAALIGLALGLRQGTEASEGPGGRQGNANPCVPTRKGLRLPLPVWLNGLWGLFGFHFFYFIALQQAPAVEASLVTYLWPLLLVLLSACLPNERLRWYHGTGAGMGFLGAALLVTNGQGLTFNPQYLMGYLAALVCAFTWSSYSVLSRQFGAVPTRAVGGFCAVTAVLAWLCHALLETTVWPSGGQWGAIALLGLGPVGLAFYTWDYGVKHGNIKALGALSYLAPLLSTLLLVATGFAQPSWALGLACLLIVGGAVLASGDVGRQDGR